MTANTCTRLEEVCDYCGLSLPNHSRRAAMAKEEGPHYCCIGCSFAASITSETGGTGEERLEMTKLGLAVFFSMSVMVFSLLLWSEQDSQTAEAGEFVLAATFYDIARYLSLLFSVPVLFLLGTPVLEHAFRELTRRKLSTDLLLSVGVVASFGFSAYHVFLGEGHVYFEIACAILVAVTLGKWLEANCKRQMTESLSSLAKLLPSKVRRIDHLGCETEIALAEIGPGETFRVLAGERIGVDGVILVGEALQDEQILTGESEPVLKSRGDRVLAGAFSIDGELVIRSAVSGGQGAIQRIVDAVTAAAHAKCKPQILAERISGWFLPAIISLAVLTFLLHLTATGFHAAMMNSLCVVLIACPCALGLATPLAIWAGIGRASREQMIVRQGDVLCELADLRVVAFDKTGTLTAGAKLSEWRMHDDTVSDLEVASIARRMALGSRHLYSHAIVEEFVDAIPCEIENLRVVIGRGVIATRTTTKQTILLGSRRFLLEAGCRVAPELSRELDIAESQGLGITLLGIDQTIVATFYFDESLRSDAEATFAALRKRGIQATILSGDHEQRVANIAKRLGASYEASLLPEEKVDAIARLRTQYGRVAMVGDGVNDAPALAAADLGIALGCGADISRQAADMCLLGNQLLRINQALEIGALTRQTVRWNLVWTFAYNLMGISLAVAGRLHPAVAAGAMVFSSLMIVIQSLRLANLELTPLQETDTNNLEFATSRGHRTPGGVSSSPA